MPGKRPSADTGPRLVILRSLPGDRAGDREKNSVNDRDSDRCFICGLDSDCAHREPELPKISTQTQVNPRVQRVHAPYVALPTRKPVRRAVSRETHEWTGTRWALKDEYKAG